MWGRKGHIWKGDICIYHSGTIGNRRFWEVQVEKGDFGGKMGFAGF